MSSNTNNYYKLTLTNQAATFLYWTKSQAVLCKIIQTE